MTWLLRPLLWLARLFAGAALAREAGRQEAEVDNAQAALARFVEIHDAQADIAVRPADSPDALLARMRDGTL